LLVVEQDKQAVAVLVVCFQIQLLLQAEPFLPLQLVLVVHQLKVALPILLGQGFQQLPLLVAE
jgi:hypothetical protein